ncbi:MAG: hypothetical protein ACR2MS_10220 [Weeksellaceae bacterium]
MNKVYLNILSIIAFILCITFLVKTCKITVNICDDIEVSKKYKNYLIENNLLDSLCIYSREVHENNFKYLNKIIFIGSSDEFALEKFQIVETLILRSNITMLKDYFNHTSEQNRFMIYMSLKLSDNPKSKEILNKINFIDNENDFYVN